jgi:alanine racemase
MQNGADPAAWIEIDLDALAQNYREAARRAGPGKLLIASIKANAYGHGAVVCAERLAAEGAAMLATGDIAEAIAIREAGIDTRIMMFGGFAPDSVATILAHDLEPTVCNEATLVAASSASRGSAPVHIKVDCGLGRLGVALEEAEAFILRAARTPGIEIAGIYTHVPFFDGDGRTWAKARVAAFEAMLDRLSAAGLTAPMTQALASSAMLCGDNDRTSAVCVGHILYGLSSMAPGSADLSAFRPVLRAVRARLIHVARHAAGRDVMIGGHYGLANAMTTGVAPMGMQQGNRGAAPGRKAEAIVAGGRAPVMSVSLEHATLDLSAYGDPAPGAIVTFLGAAGGDMISIEELAAWQGRTPLETAMTFSGHLPIRHEAVPM